MNQNKRTDLNRLICVSAVTLFLTQCLGHHFTIPKEKVKNDIKKVLVLPVYMSKDFVPNYFPKDPNFQPNAKESEEYAEVIQNTGDFLTNLAVNILSRGSYDFQTVQYTEDLLKENTGFEKMVKTIINEKPTGPTDVYFPKKEFIQKMAKKYQVDAVFYHTMYIQYKKRKFYMNSWKGSRYVWLPTYSVMYEPLMYSSNGDLIYNSDEMVYEIGALHNPESTNVEDMFRASKVSDAMLRDDLSKKNIYRSLIGGFNEKRISALASLCGNLSKCEYLYFDTTYK
ncbi:hypothetical protein [Leptospira santarosai]|uniref:hypothetical protein n=1 Tax=Leptospira santarosai TaxID=28183 RepID=UPI0002BE5C4A|nr:hypothetical protein [Leptospira santarosai]AVV79215.1 Uncharacterized protein XB15_01437 [Leptospira santarosai]EMO72007.1 hypothetical protein LEP1GSC130_3577 [Leptospira santarosai str. 200403458]